MEDLTGKQFGPYRVVAPLGEGGMAAVYRAYQASVDRYVALKVLPRYFASDPQFVGRFQQEARVLAKLQHLHILAVHDFGEADGYTYIVMPFVETGTLADLLQGEPLPIRHIGQIVSQVAGALDYAHSQGVVHRDVKPSNILIDRQGNCLLTDFGIAKIVEGTTAFTQTGGIIGTPTYMSPEQIRGDILDGRSDVYSLGVVLYEMATGRAPFRAETPPAVFVKHLHDPLPPPHIHNPEIVEGVERVILKALSKEREDRFQTTGEMAAALLKGIAGELPAAAESEEEEVPELPPAPRRLDATELAGPPIRVSEPPAESGPPPVQAQIRPPAVPIEPVEPVELAAPAALVEQAQSGPRLPAEPESPVETETPVERGERVEVEPPAVAESEAEYAEPERKPRPVVHVRPEPRPKPEARRLPKWAWGAIGGLVALAVVATLVLVLGGGGEPDEYVGEPSGGGAPAAREGEAREETTAPQGAAAPSEPGPVTIWVKVTSSSDWVDVELRYPDGEIVESNTIEVDGEGAEGGMDGNSMYLHQDITLAEEGRAISLVQEITLLGDLKTISFTVERGCVGRSLVEVYNIATGEPSLVVQSADERGCISPSTFFVALADLVDSNPPPQPTLLPTEPPGIVFFDQGNRLRDAEDWAGAMEAYDRALAEGWESAELYFQRGWVCFRIYEEGGDCYLDQVIGDYSAAIDRDDGMHSYFAERAWAYQAAGDLGLAIDDWSQAVHLRPGSTDYWRWRGVAFKEAGDLDAALADLTHAIDLGTDDPYVYADRAWAYHDLGEVELGIADWLTAAEMDPQNGWFLSELGNRYQELGDLETALEYHNRAIEVEPDYGYFYHCRAYAYMDAGDVDAAIADWTRAAELEPDNPWSWSELGNRMSEIGEYGAALEFHSRAIEIEPEYGQLYANRAWTFLSMGDSGSAEADFARAVELDPENPWLWRDLGAFYSGQDSPEAALEHYDRAIELGAGDSWFFIDRGWVRWDLGDSEGAIDDWSAAIEMDPSQPWHWWDRANGYANAGLWDEARADFEEFLRLSAENPEEYEGPRAEAEAWLVQH